MRLLIGIGTFKRISKLERLLKSLENQTYDNFVIVVSADNNDFETQKYIQSLPDYKLGHITCMVHTEQVFIIGHWNSIVKDYFHYLKADGFLGLCDDVELFPNTLEEAVKCHKANFPDTDGVVGLNQICSGHKEYTFKWFGQTLMGRKFIERYKEADYQICCPDYYHFVQDEEMHTFASSIGESGKFVCCKEAVLQHYHPSVVGYGIDEAHNIIRSGPNSPKKHDFVMQKKRQQLGYLWGKNFNLIGKKELV